MSIKLLIISKDGDFTVSLANIVKKCFLCPEGSSCVPVCAHLALDLSLDTTDGSLAPSSLHYPFRYLSTLSDVPEPSPNSVVPAFPVSDAPLP